MRKIIAAILAVCLAGLGVFTLSTSASANDGPNQAGYWKAKYPNAVECYKYDANSQGQTANGHGVSSGNTVTLAQYGADWPGDRWEVLIVKAGNTDTGSGPGNVVYNLPTAGTPYAAPEGKTVSHWIVCKGQTPNPPKTIVPGIPVPKDKCAVLNDHYGLPEGPAGVTYTRDGLAIVATITATNTLWGSLPSGWVETGTKTARYALQTSHFTDEPCTGPPTKDDTYTYGVPACGDTEVAKFTISYTFTYLGNDTWSEPVASAPVPSGNVPLAEAGYEFEPCDIAVEPSVTPTEVCGPGGEFLPGTEAGIDYLNALYDDETGIYTVYPLDGYVIVLSEGSLFTLNEDGSASFDSGSYFSDEPCEALLPVVFDSTPNPPTCSEDGTLPNLESNVEGVLFPNVTLTFDRAYDGPGEYTLTATASEGYAFADGTTVKTRVITVAGATGYQNTDPEAPCYVAPPEKDDLVTTEDQAWACGDLTTVVTISTVKYSFDFDTVTGEYSDLIASEPYLSEIERDLTADEFRACVTPVIYQEDACGIENDGWNYADTENVGLAWSQDKTVVTFKSVDENIEIVAGNGFVLNEDGTASFDVETWTWNDEACPTGATPPTAPEAPRLAATGSQAYMLGGVGLSLLLLGTIALLAKRRRRVTI